MTPSDRHRIVRFGAFELDRNTGELRCNGAPVKIQDQPLQVLELLLAHPGEMVTREEIRKHLWPDGTFVDFDHGLNTAIKKLRRALDDSAEQPRFIETLAKRGYRFRAAVTTAGAEDVPAATAPLAESPPTTPPARTASNDIRSARQPPHRAQRLAATALGALGAVAALVLALSGLPLGTGLPRRIAVLPFVNLSGDPGQDYLSDGITDELITQLGSLDPALLVIARTSVMPYKNANARVDRIGRELSVDYVVEGSVRRSEERVRIATKLVHVANQAYIWADTYERHLQDTLTLEMEVARAIAGQVHVKLRPARRRRAPVPDPRAYELYLKGRFFWNKYDEEGWNQAIRHFDEAIAVDPGYAAAWAGLADSYYQLSSLVIDPAVAIPKARAAALTALALEPDRAEAHASLGMIKAQYDWDRTGADAEFHRAIELNPNYATAHQWLGMQYFAHGHFVEALESLEKAQELDPLSMFIAITAVWPLPHLGRLEEACRRVEKVVEMYPNAPEVAAYLHDLRGEQHVQAGRTDEAVEAWLKGARMRMLCGEGAEAASALRAAYAKGGLEGYWRRQLELAETHLEAQRAAAAGRSPARYVSPLRLAELHARLGNHDASFALLQECLRHRDENLRWIKAESLLPGSAWTGLRSDPRFSDLLRRLRLE